MIHSVNIQHIYLCTLQLLLNSTLEPNATIAFYNYKACMYDTNTLLLKHFCAGLEYWEGLCNCALTFSSRSSSSSLSSANFTRWGCSCFQLSPRVWPPTLFSCRMQNPTQACLCQSFFSSRRFSTPRHLQKLPFQQNYNNIKTHCAVRCKDWTKSQQLGVGEK